MLDFCRLGFGSQATQILGCLGAEVIRVESTTATRSDPGHAPVRARAGRERARGSAAPRWPTPARAPASTAAASSTSTTPAGSAASPSTHGTPTASTCCGAWWRSATSSPRASRQAPSTGGGSATTPCASCDPTSSTCRCAGTATPGPTPHFVTMGPTAQALTGLTHLVGLPGREPAGWSFSYLDHVGGYLGAVAVLMALAHRRSTGEGQHVDVSQLEPATALGGALLLDRAVNGRSSPDVRTSRRATGVAVRHRAPTGPPATTSGSSCRAAPTRTGARSRTRSGIPLGPTTPASRRSRHGSSTPTSSTATSSRGPRRSTATR